MIEAMIQAFVAAAFVAGKSMSIVHVLVIVRRSSVPTTMSNKTLGTTANKT